MLRYLPYLQLSIHPMHLQCKRTQLLSQMQIAMFAFVHMQVR